MIFDVEVYGATGNGTTDDRAAIQTAINGAQAAGGGRVHFPRGTYLLRGPLVISASNIFLEGDGVGVSILLLADRVNNSVVRFDGQKLTPILGGGVCGLEIDGNRLKQTQGVHGIRLQWTSQVSLEDFHVHDAAFIGIAFQEGVFRGIRITNGRVEDTGSHGINLLNQEDNNGDIVITGVTVRRHGRLSASPGSGAPLQGQSAFSLTGECQVSNCLALDFGNVSSTTGFRLKVTHADNGEGGHRSELVNCYAQANSLVAADGTSAPTVGFDLSATNVRLSNSIAKSCGIGYHVRQQEGILTGCFAHNCANGFMADANTGIATDGNRATFLGCMARGGSQDGFVIEADDCTLIGCSARSKATAFVVAKTAMNTALVGCHGAGNQTAASHAGTNTQVVASPTVPKP